MTLYILSYNNYYNRIVKKENTFSDYANYIIYGPVQGVYGFTPGDGVNTTQILGSNVQMYNGQGDYLLAITDEGEIDSRWFIIDTKRERNGQWTLTLHRDLVVDYYDQVLNSPMFIEKASLKADNPLIYNGEQMTFNQIKKGEYLLFDKTKRSWIVGYIAPDAQDIWKTYATFDGTFNYPLTDYDLIKGYEDRGVINCFSNATIRYNGLNDYTESTPQLHNIEIDTESYNIETIIVDSGAILDFGAQITNRSKLNDVANSFRQKAFSNQVVLSNLYSLPSDGVEKLDLTQFNGRIVVDNETGVFYKIGVSESEVKTTETYYSSTITNTAMQNIKSELLAEMRSVDYISSNEPSTQYLPNISATIQYTEQTLTLTVISSKGLNVELQSIARQAVDAPYYMFAIPYSENNMRLAIQMGTLLGQNCYDTQLVPYCPVQDYFDDAGNVDLDDLTVGKDYEPIKQDETVVDYLFWCPYTNITFDIPFNIPVAINPAKKKVQIECDMYRLCSPNGNGEFQFNAAKNNGVSKFNVDCTYRPINPYFHINPDFGGLYGYDANDFRGLILQGDFSIPLLSDQWVNYEINNKNYQNSFNRQIENMEIQQKMGRIQDVVGGITGVGTGAASGALVGSMVAPGIGTAVGAIAGGAASLVGGIGDLFINEKLRNEAIDLTKDQFGYSLANIQARPQSIVKTGCLTVNNKKVPYLEYYSCTDEEKLALVNKLAFNGMTTMVIGTIGDYINNEWSYIINNKTIESKGYIKGQLIRLEGTEDDYHIVNSLAGELNKGVYIK